MSQAPPVGKNSTPVVDKNKAAQKDGKNPRDPKGQGPAQGPNEQTFWTRYSPHYEFPLSTVASVVAHAVVGLLFVAIFANFFIKKDEDPLPLDMVVAGGGGNPLGEGNGPGDGVLPQHHQEAAQQDNQQVTPDRQDKPPDLKPPPDAPMKNPKITEDATPTPVSAAVSKGFEAIGQDARQQLLAGLKAGKGQGGPGSGGGKGRGQGTGEGDLSGPGKQTINARQARVLRWTMKFNTFDGNDYLNQLRGLGAILAIPDRQGSYLVIRNLTPPVRPEPEDLRNIHRIFWIDSNQQSVNSLSRALGLARSPGQIVAFFPESLEKELLEKELAYRGRAEQDIKETIFEILNTGGKYTPKVVQQTTK